MGDRPRLCCRHRRQRQRPSTLIEAFYIGAYPDNGMLAIVLLKWICPLHEIPLRTLPCRLHSRRPQVRKVRMPATSGMLSGGEVRTLPHSLNPQAIVFAFSEAWALRRVRDIVQLRPVLL